MKNNNEHFWNHRVIQHVCPRLTSPPEIYYQIHEVHYRKGKPIMWTQDPIPVGGDDIKSIRWVLKMMNKCLKKPILKIVGKKRQKLVEI